MKHQDELIEQYDDATFAILMEQVIQAEGTWAMEENERLKQDPAATVPKEMENLCLKTIKMLEDKRLP